MNKDIIIIALCLIIIMLLALSYYNTPKYHVDYLNIIESQRITAALMSKRIDILDDITKILEKELGIEIKWEASIEKMIKK